jgi:hypothetical protein
MTYFATVVKVMIASPSDVSQERRVVRDVIHEWNDVHADDRKIVLMPVGWESHSSPEMGDRPQGIINKQILDGCDLLIAVFWTRLGSPTGQAPSGTVEEIEEHIGAGRPAMIYFSAAPVRADSVDASQYEALKAFRESCRERGLIEEYESITEFRNKLVRQLAQTVIRQYARSSSPSERAELYQGPLDTQLSAEGQELLLEAVKDEGGVIMKLGTFDGMHVQTNNREFSTLGDARSEAKWRAAVDELHSEGLIEDRAGKDEVFFVTNEGYRAAESIGQR